MPDRERLERIVRDWIALWNVPVDWDAFDRLHADDFVDEAAAGRSPTKQGFADGLRAMVRAFPDLRARVEDVVVDDRTGRVAVRWSATGTNAGRYLGAGPTHRATTITGIEIVEVAGDRVARRWGEWDITDHTRGAV